MRMTECTRARSVATRGRAPTGTRLPAGMHTIYRRRDRVTSRAGPRPRVVSSPRGGRPRGRPADRAGPKGHPVADDLAASAWSLRQGDRSGRSRRGHPWYLTTDPATCGDRGRPADRPGRAPRRRPLRADPLRLDRRATCATRSSRSLPTDAMRRPARRLTRHRRRRPSPIAPAGSATSRPDRPLQPRGARCDVADTARRGHWSPRALDHWGSGSPRLPP